MWRHVENCHFQKDNHHSNENLVDHCRKILFGSKEESKSKHQVFDTLIIAKMKCDNITKAVKYNGNDSWKIYT